MNKEGLLFFLLFFAGAIIGGICEYITKSSLEIYLQVILVSGLISLFLAGIIKFIFYLQNSKN